MERGHIDLMIEREEDLHLFIWIEDKSFCVEFNKEKEITDIYNYENHTFEIEEELLEEIIASANRKLEGK